METQSDIWFLLNSPQCQSSFKSMNEDDQKVVTFAKWVAGFCLRSLIGPFKGSLCCLTVWESGVCPVSWRSPTLGAQTTRDRTGAPGVQTEVCFQWALTLTPRQEQENSDHTLSFWPSALIKGGDTRHEMSVRDEWQSSSGSCSTYWSFICYESNELHCHCNPSYSNENIYHYYNHQYHVSFMLT